MRPAEPRDRRPDYQRGVGDAAGDHDVRPCADAFGDAEGTEIGVGRQRLTQTEFRTASPQVVALDVSDVDVESELLAEPSNRRCQAGRVETARVGDDRDATFDCHTE